MLQVFLVVGKPDEGDAKSKESDEEHAETTTPKPLEFNYE